MGQDWLLLDLDKRTRKNIGKLGEYIIGKSADRLIWFFAVPLLPLEPLPADNDFEESEPGCWAGDQIVCIGDYARDYPESIMDHQDVKWLEKYGAVSDSFETLYQVAEYAYEEQSSIRGSTRKTRNAFPAAAWVLRNLTKRVYVRVAAFKSEQDRADDGLPEDEVQLEFSDAGAHIGDVILSRICWSSDPSCSMDKRDSERLTRGVWAGDRLDVVTLAALDSEPWKDITEEVREDLISLWDHEYRVNPFQLAAEKEEGKGGSAWGRGWNGW
ncbi:hypothetical protein PLICRDRAFT_231146 [Plicaturopsis crispa FD-325 SS-3]|nr:hypothetical protein PLICRDRAFT_231146 [Plicaturopsis crispa FD-325 SS-3]